MTDHETDHYENLLSCLKNFDGPGELIVSDPGTIQVLHAREETCTLAITTGNYGSIAKLGRAARITLAKALLPLDMTVHDRKGEL